MPGPTHSNRSFKSNKGLKVEPGTECVIEIWDARDFETKEDIKGAIDIKIYKKVEKIINENNIPITVEILSGSIFYIIPKYLTYR